MSKARTTYVSSSEMRSFKRCRRQWWLSYVRRLRYRVPNHASNAASGTRVHKALAAYYSPNRNTEFDATTVLGEIQAEVRNELVVNYKALGGTEDTVVNAVLALNKLFLTEQSMLNGYMKWLEETGADQDYEVISEETPLIIPFTTLTITSPNARNSVKYDVNLIGIIDACLRRTTDDFPFFIDHKTVASFPRLLGMLKMNEQMLMYALLYMLSQIKDAPGTRESNVEFLRPEYARVLINEQIPGVLFNMLRRVKQGVQTKPPYYMREQVNINRHQLLSFTEHVVGVVSEMLHARTALEADYALHHNFAYPSPTADCSWDCPFFSVCPMFDDGSRAENMLSRYFETYDPLERYADVLQRNDGTV